MESRDLVLELGRTIDSPIGNLLIAWVGHRRGQSVDMTISESGGPSKRQCIPLGEEMRFASKTGAEFELRFMRSEGDWRGHFRLTQLN